MTGDEQNVKKTHKNKTNHFKLCFRLILCPVCHFFLLVHWKLLLWPVVTMYYLVQDNDCGIMRYPIFISCLPVCSTHNHEDKAAKVKRCVSCACDQTALLVFTFTDMFVGIDSFKWYK